MDSSRSITARVVSVLKAAWLRLGERFAERLECPRYNEALFRQAIDEILALTIKPPAQFHTRLTDLLHDAGVAFVLVPALPRVHVSGVARWLNPHKPLIQLSLYGKSNDKFWFSFFHEAAHILLHGKQKAAVFLDDPAKGGANSAEEVEANAWARDKLILPEAAKKLAMLPRTRVAVEDFAASIGVHPGIVVGRMQHDGLLDVTWLNALKDRFNLVK
ncbi:ImmA/IrrE family metallo-endopeptidase [Pseudoduganella violaceinigra]|uniref:ImmA/IrrE family metallo-endopeptidase n=1 Tax=Pseudoduganella violaceinigra TaxID=246602 RepID=UPI000683F745|nr:ImmA/IrrE family metallo-endopeptidase [Pseudoduganella violaceinigra]